MLLSKTYRVLILEKRTLISKKLGMLGIRSLGDVVEKKL